MIVKLRGREAEVVWHKGGEVSLRYTDTHNGYNVVAEDDPDLDWLGQTSEDTSPKQTLQALSDEELREKLQQIRQGRIVASKTRTPRSKPKKDQDIAEIIHQKEVERLKKEVAELMARYEAEKEAEDNDEGI